MNGQKGKHWIELDENNDVHHMFDLPTDDFLIMVDALRRPVSSNWLMRRSKELWERIFYAE